MPHDEQHDDDRDQHLLNQREGQGVECLVDELRAVVERHDFHSCDRAVLHRAAPEPYGDFVDLLANALDDRKGVLAKADDHHPAHGFGASIVESTPPARRAKRNPSNVPNSNRSVLSGRDDHVLEIRTLTNEAETANDVFDTIDFYRARTRVEIRVLDGLGDLANRDVVREHGLRVDIDLVLTDVPADGGNFRDPGNRLERVTNVPVLDRTELIQTERSGNDIPVFVLRLQGIPIHLAEGCGIGTQRWRGIIRQGACWKRSELLEHTGAGPVEVDVFFEDDVDAGESEHRRAADRAHAGDAQQSSRQGIGDLVFEVAGRSSRPVREYDLLILADIRQRIDGHWVARKPSELPVERRRRQSGADQHPEQDEHDELVLDEEARELFPTLFARVLLMFGQAACSFPSVLVLMAAGRWGGWGRFGRERGTEAFGR